MGAETGRWSAGIATSILFAYTLRGIFLSFLYLLLPTIARAGGASLAATSLAALVFLPVGFAWLWAPLLDRSHRLGRREWTIAALLVGAGTFGALAALDPVSDYAMVLGGALLVAAAGATIGTATDAAIIDTVPEHRRGWANALQAAGVSLGSLGVGAIGLVYGHHGWTASGLLMAGLGLVGAAALAAMPRAGDTHRDKAGLDATASIAWLFADRTARRTLLIVVISRAGLHLPIGILGAFQIDAGLSVADAALIGGIAGGLAGIVGSTIGGMIATHLPSSRGTAMTLICLGAASAFLSSMIAFLGATPALAIGLSAHVFLLSTPVFVAMHRQFMAIVRQGQHASDMSVLTGCEFLIGMMVAASAGSIAEVTGYSMLLALAAASAAAGAALAWYNHGEACSNP